MSKQLKTDSQSLTTAAANIKSAGGDVGDTHGTLSSHLKSSGVDAGKYAFQKIISDVLWDIINKVPADVAQLVSSYADGLLHLDQVVTDAEGQVLTVAPHVHGGSLQGGTTSPQPAPSAPIQGISPSLQGGSPKLQGSGPSLQG